MEYIVPSLCISAATGMDDATTLDERAAQLIQLEEDHFIVGFHQQVAKDQQKAWHDRHIKHKQFLTGDLVLLYDSEFLKHQCKLQTH